MVLKGGVVTRDPELRQRRFAERQIGQPPSLKLARANRICVGCRERVPDDSPISRCWRILANNGFIQQSQGRATLTRGSVEESSIDTDGGEHAVFFAWNVPFGAVDYLPWFT